MLSDVRRYDRVADVVRYVPNDRSRRQSAAAGRERRGGFKLGVELYHAVVCLFRDSARQQFQHLRYVAADMRVGRYVFVYFRRVDIYMQYLCVFAEFGTVARHSVGEPRADRYYEIGFAYELGDGCAPVHAYKPGAVRTVRRHCGKPHHRRGYRRFDMLGKSDKLRARARRYAAAARVNDGTLCAVDERDRIGDVRLHGRLVRRRDRSLRVLDERLLDVFRNVDEHRTGTVGTRYVERAANSVAQFGGVFDDKVMLGYRHGDARDVYFLKTVASEQGYGHVARYRDERHAVEIRVGNARDEVGRARTGRSDDDARLARGAGIALRRVRRALFVRGEYSVYLRLVVQRVEQIDYLTAGISEYGSRILFEQAFYDRRRSCDLHSVYYI